MLVDPNLPFPLMRSLVETFYDFQDQRMITFNRIFTNAKLNGITKKQLDEYGISELLTKAKAFEKDIKKRLESEVKHYPLHQEYLTGIWGIGPILSSGLLAYIGDIKRFDKISNLWQYGGFGLNMFCTKCNAPTWINITFKKKDGKTTTGKKLQPLPKCPTCHGNTIPIIQRRYTGYLNNWNDKFKVLGWKIGQSFVKQGPKSYYYNLYLQFKQDERRNHPDKIKVNGKTQFNDGHIHNRALKKVVKIFLAHLWVTWRRLEHLPVTEPYVGQILGHGTIEPIMDKPRKNVKPKEPKKSKPKKSASLPKET